MSDEEVRFWEIFIFVFGGLGLSFIFAGLPVLVMLGVLTPTYIEGQIPLL